MVMLPTNPKQTYTHKSSKRKFRLIGTEKLEDTKKWIDGEYRFKWVLSIVYLDTNELEAWLIGYNDEFIKVVEHKSEPDENKDKLLIKIKNYD